MAKKKQPAKQKQKTEPARGVGRPRNTLPKTPRGRLAAAILAGRLSANLTHDDLAAKCGVGADTVRRWENARRRPSIDSLCRLAAAIGMRIEDLVSDD